jgi:hypothetical protein
MEQKTYWWRILVILFAGILFGYGYVAAYVNVQLYNSYIDSLLFLSMSLGVVAFFSFFVSDLVFMKWFYFATLFMLVSCVLIAAIPQYSGSWAFSNPGRESVSIWLSSLFVIVSLVKLVWDTRKLRQSGADSR